jgi:DNA-binding IscR family transcriptional regulator
MPKVSTAQPTVVARWCDDVFAFIAGYAADNDGRTPTLSEIAERFKFSKSYADRVVELLAEAGRIEVVPKAWRGIKLPEVSKAKKPSR